MRREVTNAVGVYTFTTLPPGRYKLDLQQRGFKRLIQQPIDVLVQQFVTLNLQPEVGGQGQFEQNIATRSFAGWGNFSANGGMADANEVL